MPPSEIPTDWDLHYREDHTPWDKGRAAPPLLEWIEKNPAQITGRVLVPGCGRGHDVRALAGLPEVTEAVGLDLSPTAVSLANSFPKVSRERYCVGNLFDLEKNHRDTFDWVFEHTCFCAIPIVCRESYVTGVWSSLHPGGSLLSVFYLNPYDDEHQPEDGPPHGSTLEELDALFVRSGRFSIQESYVPSRSYPGREGLERVMRMTRQG